MLFTPSQAYMPNRHRQRSALRTFFPSSSFSPPDPKEPLRRGILFSSVATVLLLIGTILTWLGFNDVFGGKISMTGPLLIALALLMLLLSLRQFMLARRRNSTRHEPLQMEIVNSGGMTAVIDHDDGSCAATIVVEAWDTEEPNHDSISCRNNNDLAPPSYMDIAQSCSSNCPSFMSHEDHNEAPPTYEETCGIYGSDTSLNNVCTHHSSSQFEGSPSPQLTNHSDYGFFATCNHTYEMWPESEPADACVHTLCPSPSAESELADACVHTLCPSPSAVQSVHHVQARATCQEDSAPQSGLCADPQVTGHLARHRSHLLTCRPEAADARPHPASDATNRKPPEWSRRSFSSIPSYTCLLSESGEVSSHVFDTSSIIEEMMPLLAVQGKVREPECADLVLGTIIPTRSHSMSSVNTFRQGVPYVTSLQTGSSSPRTGALPSQPLHGQQVNSGHFIPGLTYNNLADVASKKPPAAWIDVQQGPGHNPNVADLLAVPSAQMPELVVLQSQPAQSSSLPSSWNVSSSPEFSEHGHLLPLLEVRVDMHSRSGSADITTTFHNSSCASETLRDSSCPSETLRDSSCASVTCCDRSCASAILHDSSCASAILHDSNYTSATLHDSSFISARSMISNTQDVQETI